MELLPRLAVDFFHLIAHHPAKQVDAMDALVHECSAVTCPAAAPRRLLIVGPVPVPTHVDGTMRQPSKTPLIQCGPHPLYGEIKAILMAYRHFSPRLTCPVNDPIGILHGHGHGFFDDHMQTCIKAGQGNLRVHAGIGGDSD